MKPVTAEFLIRPDAVAARMRKLEAVATAAGWAADELDVALGYVRAAGKTHIADAGAGSSALTALRRALKALQKGGE